MKLIIKIMALNCAFFVSSVSALVEREPSTNSGGTTYKCTYRGSEARINFSDISQCQAVIETGLIEQEYKPSPRNGFAPYAPIEDSICDIKTVVQDSIYSIECRQKFGSIRQNDDGTTHTDNYTVRANGTMNSPEQSPDTWECLNPDYPVGPIEEYGYYYCEQEPEPEPPIDEDCPAPTDSDPFVFGVSNTKTTVCYDAGNGRQCSIQTSDDGSYYLPVSYSSQEPVTCVPDPVDPVDPVDPPPEVTPDPEPIDPPTDTDNSDKSEVLDATNQINDNLDAINQNLNTGIASNNERLDRLAKETQIGNELISEVSNRTATGNEILFDINENLKGQIDGDGQLLNEVKKLNEATYTGQFNPENSASFYSTKYPDGIEGVWNEKSEQFKQTDAFAFIQQFKFNSGGTAPRTQICFNLGTYMDFGCSDLPLPSMQLLAIIKIFILVTAAFLCRALIFGG